MANLNGRRLGQYELIEPIGEGGMATVYRARQTSVGRDVAVKIIHAGMANNPESVKRFEREAHTIASLSHPHILKLFDYGQNDDLLYLVMELMAGGSLSRLLHHGPASVELTTRLVNQVAQALDYAHRQGIVHRDLKPQNVLLDASQNAFLSDFGIVKLLQANASFTQDGLLLGTPGYMAPEQWISTTIDARTDIYAFGVMLFELLTGKLPFTGDTPFNVMNQHMMQPPPSLHSLGVEVPAAVERVIQQALAKEPNDRFQTAGELADAFNQAVQPGGREQVDSSSGRKPITDPGQKKIAKSRITTTALAVQPRTSARPVRFIAIISGALVALSVVAIAVVLLSKAPTNLFVTGTPIVSANTLVSGAVSPEMSGEPVGLASVPSATSSVTPTMTHQQTATETASAILPPPTFTKTTTVTLLPATPTASTTAILATFTETPTTTPLPPTPTASATAIPATFTAIPTTTLLPPTFTNAPTVTALPPTLTASATTIPATFTKTPSATLLSPTLTNTAEATATRTASPMPSPSLTQTPTLIPTTPAPARTFATVPATVLASARLAGFNNATTWVTGVAFSPDGTQLATSSADHIVRIFDVQSAKVIANLIGHKSQVLSVAFSPDGLLIASGGLDRTVRLWDAKTHKALATLSGHTGAVLDVTFSPDGKMVASASADGTARLWDVTQRQSMVTLKGHTGAVWSIAFSPDSKEIVTGGDDHTVRLWDAASGNELNALLGHSGSVYGVAFSPDGSTIASASEDKSVRLWNVANETSFVLTDGQPSAALCVAFSPTTGMVLAGYANANMELWNATSGQKLTLVTGHTAPVMRVAFAPDGSAFASGSQDGTWRWWKLR